MYVCLAAVNLSFLNDQTSDHKAERMIDAIDDSHNDSSDDSGEDHGEANLLLNYICLCINVTSCRYNHLKHFMRIFLFVMMTHRGPSTPFCFQGWRTSLLTHLGEAVPRYHSH